MVDVAPSGQPVALLATEALCRNFGGLAAVRDVSITLLPGELHAVIGPNGAGKSTLVNLLSGDIRPSSGQIKLEGRDIAGQPAHRMAHLGIARSFQRTNIFASLTVLENVRLAVQAVTVKAGRLLRTASRETKLEDDARAVLARVGLDGFASRIAATLAHGQQRQLEIAMALASDPKVLLLDEPLAGMGPEEAERLALLFKKLAKAHALLLIEHDMDFVFAVADRMTVMVEGSVLAAGAPASVRADPQVQRAYLGGHA